MYTHNKNIVTAGKPVAEAKKALIMLHGRGSTAQDIISLSRHLDVEDTAIFAPQASEYSWYPTSFMAPVSSNQPALDSALHIIKELVEDITSKGIPADKIHFLGFSQGACLSLEFAARYAQTYGGVIAFTGGLIGEKLDTENYQGDFGNTPILITTGDPDPHVPLKRVEESVVILTKMHADVTLKVYKGRQHTIQMEEIELANQLILKNKPE